MKKIAIEKAKKRMAEAGHYFFALDGILTVEQFEYRWSSFLNAINRAFMALDAGARDDAATRTWWAKRKHEWKKDPLLQYLHQARNTDEHGLEPLTEITPGHFSSTPFPGVDPETVSHWKLIPVRNDKFGDVFDVPTKHLGQDIPPGEIGLPWYTAIRAMGYYNRLIPEAETYVT